MKKLSFPTQLTKSLKMPKGKSNRPENGPHPLTPSPDPSSRGTRDQERGAGGVRACVAVLFFPFGLKILFFLKILALLIILPAIVRAEGPLSGGTRIYIEDEPLGPFTVSSFAAPNPPMTSDRLWVTVEVRDGGKAVADAQVWVTVLARQQDVVQRMEAVHELAPTSFDYTAALDVPEADTYEVLIEMKHERGAGEVRYTVNVSEPMTNFILILMAGPALLIAIALIHRFVIRMPNSVAVLAGDDEPLSQETTK